MALARQKAALPHDAAVQRAIAALKEVAAGQLTTGPYSVINKTILSASWGSPLPPRAGVKRRSAIYITGWQPDSLSVCSIAYF